MSELFQESSPQPEPHGAQPPIRRQRRWRRWLIAGLAAMAFLVVGVLLYLQSAAFQQAMRRRLVAALEQSTGARVELGEFAVNWSRLEVSLRGLVLHGSEAASEPPLFRAEWLVARWRLVSFWTLDADLAEIRVLAPAINIVVGEDGRSNLPPLPRVTESRASSSTPSSTRWAARLLALQIGRFEVVRGQLRWNQRHVPLDFRAEQLHLGLDYEKPKGRYTGKLDFRNAILIAAGPPQLDSQVQIKFAFDSDHAEIESADWRAPKSRLTLQGTVSDYRAPRFEFSYDLTADWSDLGPFLHSRGWVGDMTWRGQGIFGGGPWELAGDLEVRTQRNGIPGWSELPWTAHAKLRLAPDAGPPTSTKAFPWQATLANLRVETLGGELAGSASVRNSSAGPLTSIDLEARRLSFPAMTNAMTALPVKLDSLLWAGAVSGPLHARFIGPGREFTAEADWEVSAPLAVPPNFTPITGKLIGSYDGARKRLESNESYVDLPNSHLSGSGWFDDHQSQMRLAASTTDLSDIRTLSELVWNGSGDLPLKLDGRASAEMSWTGGTERPRITGDFRVADFTYKNQRWDSFTGRMDYRHNASASQLAAIGGIAPPTSGAVIAISSAELKRNTAEMNFDLRIGPEAAGFGDHSPFSIQGRVRGFRSEELETLAGREYPLQGVAEATFDVSGTRREPTGRGTVSLTDGTLYGESFDRFTADMHLDQGVWTADPVRLQRATGTLQGKVMVDQPKQQFRFDLSGAGIPLESLRSLREDQAQARLSGVAEGNVSGEGSFEKPQVRGQVRIRQFGYGALQSGTLTIDIESHDERASWTANGDLWGGQVRAQGETTLSGSFPLTADINFENLDLPPLVRAFRDPPENLAGRITGTLRAEGDAKNLKAITLRGELASLEASIRAASVRTTGPVQFQYQNNVMRIDQLRLQGPKVEFETSGTVRLGQEPLLNLNAKGQMDLAALGQADPQFASSGKVQIDAQITGTAKNPLWRGNLLISDGAVHYGNLPNGFDRINGTVVFEGSRGILENVKAESGGGQLQIVGFVSYGEGTGWQFNLTGDATLVRIRYPEGLSTWVSGQLAWNGTIHSSLLEGRVLLTRQSVSPQFDLVRALLSRKNERAAAAMPEVLRNMRLGVEVASATDLRLDTLTTRNLQTDVELRIQGTAEQPVWLGRIGILEGEILFAGKRYAVNRGEISFVNPFRFEPVLNLSVQARVQRYDISMDFNGPPDRLTVTYRSDPPLPTRDILNLLVAGSARDTSLETTTNQALPQVGADALLSQALQSQIGTRLDRLFGTGRVHVDPQISGLGRSTNASVALEQQISDNISVLYVTDVTSTQQQTVQAEWNISPKLSVVAIRDQNGLVGVNFQITLRFR